MVGMMTNSSRKGQVACIDVTRTSCPTSWGAAAPPPDRCECLTHSGPQLHTFSLGEGSGPLSLDRPLLCYERAAVQGFAPALFVGQDDGLVRRSVGNAMAVPVVASVIAREMSFDQGLFC